MDAIFMPVQKVDFKIENIYDNSSSITERLFLNIWTNGSISPEDAILSASKFIIELFNSIMENKFTQQIDKDATATSNLIPINPHINIAIEELQLSVRAYNCLKRAEI
jgi:DNA-directed RNA polymerase subunit alpha